MGAGHAGDHQERDKDGNPICEAGCYCCLLSYYNQPDHELIDGLDKANEGLAPKLLTRLARATLRRLEEQADTLERVSGSSLERAWLAYLEESGLRSPDRAQVDLPYFQVRPDFVYDAH